MSNKNQKGLSKTLGTWEVMVSSIALVVAASSLVSDFAGYFTLGSAFTLALVLGFIINMLLGFSAADLGVAYPRSGALYDYARAIFGGKRGQFIGVFLGLSFFGMFIFAISGEVVAGAFGLQALFHSGLDIRYFILILSVLAVIPNIFGIRTTAWVSAFLLLFMLGIRWFFGIAGLLGLGETGAWAMENLDSGVDVFDWFGEKGILTAGLALAIWGFIGIESACSLAEEVKQPKKSLPKGIVLGLIIILATSLVMGLGITGTAPLSVWQDAMNSGIGANGDAPQLAVGQMMFGEIGYLLMALSSVAATLGSLVVAYAAIPRIIYSIARDGRFFGRLSKTFGTLHVKHHTPIAAILFTFILSIIPALFSSAVIDWVYSAAYVWIILYAAFHLLALTNRIFHPDSPKAFTGRWFKPMTILGVAATLTGLYYAFAGAHFHYGIRALVVLIGALVATGISFLLPSATETGESEGLLEISEAEIMTDLIGAHSLVFEEELVD